MKKVLLLGASGSIGTQTLDVINKYLDRFELVGFSVGNKSEYIDKIIKEFPSVKYVYVTSDDTADEYKVKYPNIAFYSKKDTFIKLINDVDFDMCVEALVGISGLVPAIEVLKKNKILCLANKEALVTGGHLINKLLDDGYGKLYPIDSEHVALAKCLSKVNKDEVEGLYLTASGGALRDIPFEKLGEMKASDALKHPNWKMGDKITIDCATMMNKGFEVIEAHHLFNIPFDKIDVVLHKESAIHSMVEYNDGSIIAQMGNPDMHLPIKYALLYPKHLADDKTNYFDFDKFSQLNFKNMDYKRYPLVKIAKEIGKHGGNICAILNGANDEAVDLFINKKIKFIEIETYILKTLKAASFIKNPTAKQLVESHEWAKKYVDNLWANS